MQKVILYILVALARVLLSLRYRFIVKGLDVVSQKGAIFVPNHVSFSDPVVLFAFLWPRFKIRPLAVEFLADLPFVSTCFSLLRAVLIPDFETSVNQYKTNKAAKSMQAVLQGLAEGDNFLIFPTGKLKNQGKEQVKGSSAIYEILQKLPETHIVLVRISGFWGSRYSKAATGKSPNAPLELKRALKVALKNFLFFVPKRKIYLEFLADPIEMPKKGTKTELNQYIENWFNHYLDDFGKVHEAEPLKLIPYYFWSKKLPEVSPPKEIKGIYSADLASKEVEEKVAKEIRKILDQPEMKIGVESRLGEDLGMDSLNIAEMLSWLSKTYSVENVLFDELQTVGDLVAAATSAKSKNKQVLEENPFSWPFEENRPDPDFVKGRTFQEAFLNVCEKMGSLVAMADDLTGPVSYNRAKKGVLVLSEAFRAFPESHIALLLPPSVGSTIAILAILFAGKTPVLLNWTLGPRYLEHMMNLTGSKRAISSWRFMERINHVDFGSVADQIVLLEDIRKKLSLKTKLKGLFLSSLSPDKILRKLKLDQVDENSTLVVLFTSGTEAMPKGVPLSHKNVLSTIYNCFWNFHTDCDRQAVIYDILPQFHSFGFSVCTFVPLFSAMRVAFYPNPADSFAVAKGAQRWKVTIFPIVPNFLKKLFQVAKPEELATVRFFTTAGEKTPIELFDTLKKMGLKGEILEGYGLSETSPVIALTRMHEGPKGVGKLLPNVQAVTIHPETQKLLLDGETGEICVRGPNVFSGYLGKATSPFIEIDGKSWFRTGDIGYVDKDQSLILTGRLKRFIKLGGEMISLGAIEEALIAEYKKENLIREDVPSLALCSDESDVENPKLILYAIFSIEKDAVNETLKNLGFSNLIKISSVEKVDEIPVTATGKTNYRSLEVKK